MIRTQAAQGDAGAQGILGILYDQGRGVPQDYTKARLWYEKTAAQGNADAQTLLGVLYYYGRGVPQDYMRAHMWLNLAAARYTGDEQKDAAKYRDLVAGVMTPAQIAEAQRLAQQCEARQFKGC
jgi:TPR repeat protein